MAPIYRLYISSFFFLSGVSLCVQLCFNWENIVSTEILGCVAMLTQHSPPPLPGSLRFPVGRDLGKPLCVLCTYRVASDIPWAHFSQFPKGEYVLIGPCGMRYSRQVIVLGRRITRPPINNSLCTLGKVASRSLRSLWLCSLCRTWEAWGLLSWSLRGTTGRTWPIQRLAKCRKRLD